MVEGRQHEGSRWRPFAYGLESYPAGVGADNCTFMVMESPLLFTTANPCRR